MSAQDRFSRIQWSALVTNLSLFGQARWYNSPVATYRAEFKALQLCEAARIGMSIPATTITNAPHQASAWLPGECFAVKGLDTVMVRESGEELFGFTTFANRADFDDPSWASAPAVIQEAISDKVDVRVTVIDERVFAVKILVSGKGVSDDWRLHKQRATFIQHNLPDEVARHCVQLVASFGLRYGAIDMALSEGVYYFLEINPTGEWAWLVNAAGLRIDEALADAVSQ